MLEMNRAKDMSSANILPVKHKDFDVEKETSTTQSTSRVEMLFCALGLIFSFVIYGLLQERIMTIPYGVDGVLFSSTTYIVLSNRIIAVIGAFVVLWFNKEEVKPHAPIHKFFLVALLNTTSTYCQWESLKYVSFPTQTLGKCGKTIPVLILGYMFAGKKYDLQDAITCVSITLGCTIFVLSGDIHTHPSAGESDTLYGLLFIVSYLCLDGSTSLLQERIFRNNRKMPVHSQMLYVNMCSGIIVSIMLLLNGEFISSIHFSIENPSFFIGSTSLSFAAMFGQMMLYYTIQKFGALFYATVMTTRQIFSIVLSCIIYFHPLSPIQIIGAVVVFAAVYLKSFRKSAHQIKPEAPPANTAIIKL